MSDDFLKKSRRERYEVRDDMEQVRGIEPPCSAWEADILPLNYTCNFLIIIPCLPPLFNPVVSPNFIAKFLSTFYNLPLAVFPFPLYTKLTVRKEVLREYDAQSHHGSGYRRADLRRRRVCHRQRPLTPGTKELTTPNGCGFLFFRLFHSSLVKHNCFPKTSLQADPLLFPPVLFFPGPA